MKAEPNPGLSATRWRHNNAFTDGAGPELTTKGPVLVLPPQPRKPKSPNRWVQRTWLVVFVLFCLEVGIILTVLPWTKVWNDNTLLLGHPVWRNLLMQHFVRGAVSGLGLVDIWMGIAEAVGYHESDGS
jgi:hypothetical protein